MGKEAVCRVRVNGQSARSTVHLDSTTLRLSGGHRLMSPLADLRAVTVVGDTLSFSTADAAIDVQLGPGVAARWAAAISNPRSRLEKLGVRAAERVCIRGIVDSAFFGEVCGVLAAPPAVDLNGSFDIIFQGVSRLSELDEIARGKQHLTPAGALWVVRPKGRESEIDEHVVRAAILHAGLVDTKVVAFSATLTAIKAVIRLKDRIAP